VPKGQQDKASIKFMPYRVVEEMMEQQRVLVK
jgi:hypothetical protein